MASRLQPLGVDIEQQSPAHEVQRTNTAFGFRFYLWVGLFCAGFATIVFFQEDVLGLVHNAKFVGPAGLPSPKPSRIKFTSGQPPAVPQMTSSVQEGLLAALRPLLQQTSRRAALARAASLAAGAMFPAAARAAGQGRRGEAQSVGIVQSSPLPDPRDWSAEKGIIWGGRERCDPTDTKCQQGGISNSGESAVQPLPATPAGIEITDKVQLTISVAGQSAGNLVLGFWRPAAPKAVETFLELSRGTLAPTPGDQAASYEDSRVARISKDNEVVFGQLGRTGGQMVLMPLQTRPQLVEVAPPMHSDVNGVSHNQAGLVSVPQGGGSFEFSITTRASPSLDKKEVVIGQVLEGMEIIERLNTLPINRYSSRPLAVVTIERLAVL